MKTNNQTLLQSEKIDLLLEEQIKVLFESQAKQLEIFTSIENKIKNS
jgi:hypothetical protein